MDKGKSLLLGLMALSLLPILLVTYNLLNSQAFLPEENFLVLGSIFGLTGFMIMWWQYVLGARFVFRVFTRDLLWVNNIHQILGKYGFLVILVHPVLIYTDRILYGLGITLPNFASIYDRNMFLGQISIAILGGIWVMSALVRGKFSYRLWKRIHLLTYTLLFFLFIHSVGLGIFINQPSNEWFYFYWVFLFIIFALLSIGRIFFQFGGFKGKYKVLQVDQLTHDTFTLKLMPLGKRIEPKRGQFVYIQHSLTGETHPYTVSHFNDVTGELRISTKNLGRFSIELQNLKAGHKVYLDGPYGVFTTEAYTSSKPIVLIAGGIGITPFCRLIDYFKLNPSQNPGITLFYGNKSEDDIAFKEMLDSAKSAKFKTVHVLSLQESVPEGFEKGFINSSLLKKYLGDLPSYNYFLCGPPVMIKKLVPDLIAAGISKEQIYSEKFSM